ncbi:hypothetical protein LUX05_08225 [Streptomyces somaliensis]|nr:hypothetical protein [Streptomyces somaliensis]
MAEAAQGAHQDADEPSLDDLIERSAELKGGLVAFAQSARFDRWLTPLLLDASGPARRLDEGEAIRITDHFVLRYRLPDGSTVVDRFVAGRKDLTAADREMLLGWRDPVEGVFEVRCKDGDAVVLLNLLDDLEYRTYSNVGRAAFRGVSKGGFLHARLVPVQPAGGAWLVPGAMTTYPRSSATDIAQAALRLATHRPEPAFRNPEKIKQGWRRMREDRAAFVEFCGGDELVLADYGMLRELFADPARAGRRQHQNLLRTYLREESITPLPIRRLASAHPEEADVVFRKLVRKPGFSWSEHGETLLRRHKPWYYESDPRPGVSVIGDRLRELLGAGRC